MDAQCFVGGIHRYFTNCTSEIAVRRRAAPPDLNLLAHNDTFGEERVNKITDRDVAAGCFIMNIIISQIVKKIKPYLAAAENKPGAEPKICIESGGDLCY